MVKTAYCKKKKVPEMPGMEIDIQTFFNVMLDVYMLIAEKKLLRAVILLSFVRNNIINILKCGETKKYEEIDQIVQSELRDYNPYGSSLEMYKVEGPKIKKLILKTFPEIE